MRTSGHLEPAYDDQHQQYPGGIDWVDPLGAQKGLMKNDNVIFETHPPGGVHPNIIAVYLNKQ